MKTYKNLFNQMLEPENMKACLKKAAAGKKHYKDVDKILNNPDYYLSRLREFLESENYEFSSGSQTILNETSNKKERVITKPKFKYDQIVHNLIVSQLEPIILKSLYEFACGSVPDRGPHFGKKYLRKWITSYGNQPFYVLKADIKHFYDSIDHEILKKKLGRKIKDEKFLNIVFNLIDSYEPGIPKGYCTSPWFANFFLTELDHYIKETLKAPHYIRYMDDIVILSSDKKELHRIKDELERFLKEELKLELKDNWQIYRFMDKDDKTGRDIDFMGFRFFRNKTTLRKSNLRTIRRKANKLNKKREEHNRGVGRGISVSDARSMLSYLGWTKHADVYNYHQKEIKSKVSKRQLRKKVSAYDKKSKLED